MTTNRGYDAATKLWTCVLAVIVMLLIQWPALFVAHSKHPPHHGNMAWTLIAGLIALAPPLAWLLDDVARKRLPMVWGALMASLGVWLLIAITWVNP